MPCKLLQDPFLAQAVAMQCRWRCIDSHHCIPLPGRGSHDVGPGLPVRQSADDSLTLQQQVGTIATCMCVCMDVASMAANTSSVHGCYASSMHMSGEARTQQWLLSEAAALRRVCACCPCVQHPGAFMVQQTATRGLAQHRPPVQHRRLTWQPRREAPGAAQGESAGAQPRSCS